MDAVVKKLVAERLNLQASGPHPDPDLLAGFAENCVSAAERGVILQHVAACADCRAILYAAAPALKETQAVSSYRAKQPRFAVRWATLAASVIILGSVLVTNRSMFSHHPQPVASVPQPLESTSEQRASAQEPAAKANAGETAQKFRAPLKHMTARPQGGMQFDDSGEVHFAAAPSSAVPAPQKANAAPSAARSVMTLSQVAATPATWRLSPDGTPQRSSDGAHSWQAVPVEEGLRFRAINSVGNEVWVGGTSGTVYHSVDAGETWSRVEIGSADDKLQSDISQIQFTDALNGAITTATGEVWNTSDGGKNWQLK